MSEEIVLREALKGVWETVHAISNIVWNAKSEPILKIKQLAEKAESELEAALASQPSGVSGNSVGPQHVGGDRVIQLYSKLTTMAQSKNQVIGEKNDYYVTLWQVESVVKEILEKAAPHSPASSRPARGTEGERNKESKGGQQ